MGQKEGELHSDISARTKNNVTNKAPMAMIKIRSETCCEESRTAVNKL
jgi:hypothetical protein